MTCKIVVDGSSNTDMVVVTPRLPFPGEKPRSRKPLVNISTAVVISMEATAFS